MNKISQIVTYLKLNIIIEILQLRAKSQTSVLSCSRFLSDHIFWPYGIEGYLATLYLRGSILSILSRTSVLS